MFGAMFVFEVCVTAEGAEAAVTHLDAFSEGSGPDNVPDLRLSLLHTGPNLAYSFKFINYESSFHYECDVIYFFLF